MPEGLPQYRLGLLVLPSQASLFQGMLAPTWPSASLPVSRDPCSKLAASPLQASLFQRSLFQAGPAYWLIGILAVTSIVTRPAIVAPVRPHPVRLLLALAEAAPSAIYVIRWIFALRLQSVVQKDSPGSLWHRDHLKIT